MMGSTPPSAGDNALAILAAASNPEQAKAYIQEIMRVTQEMQKTLEETREANIQAESIKRAIDEGEANVSRREKELEDKVAEHKAEVEALEKHFQERDITIRNSEENSANKFQELMATKVDIDQRLSKVVSREDAISRRENDVTKREEAVTSLEASVNDKLNNLKAIVNG